MKEIFLSFMVKKDRHEED